MVWWPLWEIEKCIFVEQQRLLSYFSVSGCFPAVKAVSVLITFALPGTAEWCRDGGGVSLFIKLRYVVTLLRCIEGKINNLLNGLF